MVTLVYHGGKCLIHCSCLVGSFYFSLIYLEWMVFFSRFFKQMSFLTKMRYEFEVFLVWICLVSNRVYSILVQTFEKIKICLSWMTSTFDTAFSKTGCCQSCNLFSPFMLEVKFHYAVGKLTLTELCYSAELNILRNAKKYFWKYSILPTLFL